MGFAGVEIERAGGFLGKDQRNREQRDEALLPGRPYWLKIGARTVAATVTDIKHKINVNTLEHLAAKELVLNEIAMVNISLDQATAFDPYEINSDLGGFILIDRLSNATVGAGMLRFSLRKRTGTERTPSTRRTPGRARSAVPVGSIARTRCTLTSASPTGTPDSRTRVSSTSLPALVNRQSIIGAKVPALLLFK